MSAPLVVLTPEQLEQLVRSAVRAELAAQRNPQPAQMSVLEAAHALGCTERHVRRLVRVGRIRATKLTNGGSSRVRIARADIERIRKGEQ